MPIAFQIKKKLNTWNMANMKYVGKIPGFSLHQKPVEKIQAIAGIRTLFNSKELRKANQKMLKETQNY